MTPFLYLKASPRLHTENELPRSPGCGLISKGLRWVVGGNCNLWTCVLRFVPGPSLSISITSLYENPVKDVRLSAIMSSLLYLSLYTIYTEVSLENR